MSLDGFSLYAAAIELNRELMGGRIDRIFQPNKHTILLQIRQPGQNHTLHISILPQNPVINLIDKQIDNPPAPPVFCMVLRKQLEDGRIAAIRQLGCDRAVAVDIDVRGVGGIIVTKTLIAELMDKYSNLILIENGIIIDCIKKVGITTSRVRQVLPNHPYSTPPDTDRLNLLQASSADFISRLKSTPEQKLVKAIIAAGSGVGPVTARELCFRAGLPGNMMVSELADCDFASLAAELSIIVKQFQNEEFMPTVVTDVHKKLLAMAAFELTYLTTDTENRHYYFDTLSAALNFSSEVTGSYRMPEKELLQKLVHNETARAEHKLTLLQDELSTANDAEHLRINGDILMTYQYQAQTDKHTTTISLPNLYSDNPEANMVAIQIDPLISLSQNSQNYYNKYNKAKRAQEQLVKQIEQCQNDIVYLKSLDASLKSSDTLNEIAEIKTELAAAGFITLPKKKKSPDKLSKPLMVISPDNTTIFIGKNNFQNDRLTMKMAQPNDLWLHTKDIPGSHVIIRRDGSEISKDTLHLAAQLAAHFSKAQDSGNIPVDYTQKRYVKKPSGSKPGFVIYTNQKTLFVSPDRELIDKYIH